MEIFQTSDGFPFEYPQFLMAFCNRVKFGSVIFSLGVAAYMESVEEGLEQVGGHDHISIPCPGAKVKVNAEDLGIVVCRVLS